MSAHPRLSLNQATIKRATLATALRVAVQAGIPSIGLWRESVAEVGLERAARALAHSGLRFSSLCRGGFFTATSTEERRAAVEENRRAIEETRVLAGAGATGSAPVLVLVAGGLPSGSRDLRGAREQVADVLAELAPEAHEAGVRLALEPLHPMYAADRAVISTLGQALDLAEPFPANTIGVVVDAFHVWWDPELDVQIARAGASRRIASYQVCDWLVPMAADPLLSRGMMGDGAIDFGPMTAAIMAAGYDGDVEVEIFNRAVWEADPADVARRVVASFSVHVPLPFG